MKALVISGGGSFGAYGGGTIARIAKDYQLVAGVSTGSLLAPLAALREYDRLKEAYTSVSQKDIFSYNPFRSNGKIHVPKALWRVINGKTTLGETHALRRTIDKFLLDEDLYEIRRQGKEVIVACQETSRSPELIHYFSTKSELVWDFKDWMWASANAPMVTTLLYKSLQPNTLPLEWCDAGVTELLSLKKVIQMGARDIDVIIHRTRPEIRDKPRVKDLFHNAARLFSIIRHEVESDDLQAGIVLGKHHLCNMRVFYLPRRLADNSLIFDKAQMHDWWQEGYETALDQTRIDTYLSTEAPSQPPPQGEELSLLS